MNLPGSAHHLAFELEPLKWQTAVLRRHTSSVDTLSSHPTLGEVLRARTGFEHGSCDRPFHRIPIQTSEQQHDNHLHDNLSFVEPSNHKYGLMGSWRQTQLQKWISRISSVSEAPACCCLNTCRKRCLLDYVEIVVSMDKCILLSAVDKTSLLPGFAQYEQHLPSIQCGAWTTTHD